MRHSLALSIAAVLLALSATAEVELSLTVEGTAEEIAAVLQFLQTSGLSGGGGVQVQVESNFTRPDAPEPAAETPPPPPPPSLALTNPGVTPVSVRPGTATLLSVDVIDTERKVDTITATLGDNVFAADLYDNGMRGDVAAGDGRWSVLLNVPVDLPDGPHTITIEAYDAQGARLSTPGPDGQPQAISVSLVVNVSRA